MPLIVVRVEQGQANNTECSFSEKFRIGRDSDCEVQIVADASISRCHAEVYHEKGCWWIHDANSTNGTFVDGKKIDRSPLTTSTTVRFGKGATLLSFVPDTAEAASKSKDDSLNQFVRHYFDGSNEEGAGERTLMIRRAFASVQTREKRKYFKVLAVAVLLFILSGGYAIYLHSENAKQKERAEAIFYAMKSIELDVANIQRMATESQNHQGLQLVNKFRGQRKEMEENYEHLLRGIGVYNAKLSEPDRLIYRLARVFGECEINMPAGFIDEVKTYIRKWQSSDRLERAVRTARENNYVPAIAAAMLGQGLPPQYFYLALQESNFDTYIVGPKTYKGHAKGMWQFIPETAVKYGLQVGPLVDLGRPDPADDRHNFAKATNAAARYLKFIYSTEAQASGLLVMSSYNWGEERVVNLLRTMPTNPRERNFWQLLARYRDKVPQETYDYVYYIFSAAVIGENPRLFGFKFENPLSHLDR